MAEDQKPWTDGIDTKGLWTYTEGDRWTRKPIRNDALWERIVEARKLLIQKALAWREDAMADGWQSAPTYSHEPEATAFRLTKDGWIAQGLARPAADDSVGAGTISCWAPDGMHVPTTEIYDWWRLERAAKTCEFCHAFPVETKRVAFVNRACLTCEPIESAKLEPNWAE